MKLDLVLKLAAVYVQSKVEIIMKLTLDCIASRDGRFTVGIMSMYNYNLCQIFVPYNMI